MNNCVVYIIPDENKISDGIFHMETTMDHLPSFQLFSDRYKLGYHFHQGSGDFQNAPLYFANDGHLIVRIREDSKSLICYFPRIITDQQNIWLHDHIMLLLRYDYIGCYAIKENNNINDLKVVEGVNAIIREADQRNLSYKEITSMGYK